MMFSPLMRENQKIGLRAKQMACILKIYATLYNTHLELFPCSHSAFWAREFKEWVNVKLCVCWDTVYRAPGLVDQPNNTTTNIHVNNPDSLQIHTSCCSPEMEIDLVDVNFRLYGRAHVPW